MEDFTLQEAQLYRMLVGLFGKERIVPRMSALSVCGGEIPDELDHLEINIAHWARDNKCLFTIVDKADNPKMVMEFFSGFGTVIEAEQVEHQRFLKPLLAASDIQYVVISDEEFSEILDPNGHLDFLSFLGDKVEGLNNE